MRRRSVVPSLVVTIALLLALNIAPAGAYAADLPVFEVATTPEASMTTDTIFTCCGEGWTSDTSVSVEVFGSPGGGRLFGPYSVLTDAEGSFEIGPDTHGLDLVAGMQVVVTGDTTGTSKDLTLAEISFDELDADNDIANGNAPAGSSLWVEAGIAGTENFFGMGGIVANETGAWSADFGTAGFDVTPEMGGAVHLSDEDGDTTRAGIAAPSGPSYMFNGFFRPVDNRPTVNQVKAGQAVPIKFSLGGDFGLDVLAPGSPSVGTFACGNPDLDPIEWTASASNPGLTYDSGTDQYTYVWKTSKSWAGTCQRLTLEFNDWSVQTADFKFK